MAIFLCNQVSGSGNPNEEQTMATIYGTDFSNAIFGTELDDFLYSYARGRKGERLHRWRWRQ